VLSNDATVATTSTAAAVPAAAVTTATVSPEAPARAAAGPAALGEAERDGLAIGAMLDALATLSTEQPERLALLLRKQATQTTVTSSINQQTGQTATQTAQSRAQTQQEGN